MPPPSGGILTMNLRADNIESIQSSATVIHKCRLCDNPLSFRFTDLGMSPPCESFVPPNEIGNPETYYPLSVFVCEECLLVQLPEHVNPETIFGEYAYFSSYSQSWVNHARLYCDAMVARLGLGENSLVVELASNDGYLLQHFLPHKVPVIGIEPAANVARVALEKGVPTDVAFFGRELATAMAQRGQKADLIVGNNVLAQVPDLNDFVAGIKILLKDEGTVTLEFPHLQRLMDENQFDTIYHEHFSYFSLLTIEKMAARHGLKVVDVEELSTHGGSLRVFLSHLDNGRSPSKNVSELLNRELAAGMAQLGAYAAFDDATRRAKRNLLSYLIELKNAGARICGYGAPGKGNTLLNYCGIGTDFLDFTVDRNPYKHGRFTPGMHIPIKPVDAIDEAKPDYILILPWNLKNEIVSQMKHVVEWGCKFIVPIPTVSVIDPKELQP
jgi:hypothetical protein